MHRKQIRTTRENTVLEKIEEYESYKDVIYYTILSSGRAVKEIAIEVWKNDDPYHAHRRLLDVINLKKRQKLDLDEIIRLCRACDNYAPLRYFAEKCDYNAPSKKTVEIDYKEMCQNMVSKYQAMVKTHKEFLEVLDQWDRLIKSKPELYLVEDKKISF